MARTLTDDRSPAAGDGMLRLECSVPVDGRGVRQARAVQTRKGLLAAAVRLWTDQDFDDITINAIVEAAGVSKGTFFYHYRRKEDLLLELGWSTVERVGEEAETAYERHGDLDEAIDAGLAGLSRRILAMPKGAVARTLREFNFQQPSTPPHEGGRLRFFSGLFRAAHDAGDLPKDIDPEELADVVNGVIIDTILYVVTGRVTEPLDVLLRRRTRFVLYGIRPAPDPPSPRRRAKEAR